MDSIITFLNTTGKSFVDFSSSMLIQSSVLIIVLLVLDLILRKKVRAVFLYCIWLLVLVKLVLPTTLSAPTGLGYWAGVKVPGIITEKASIPEQTASILQRIEPVSETIPSGIGTAVLPSASTSPEPTADTSANFTIAASPATASLSWQSFVFLGWLVVVIAMVLLLIQRMFFVRGLLAKSKNPNDSMVDIFERCRNQMGVHRSIFLKLSPVVASPSVCGLFRPTILIPQNLPGKLKAEDLRSILLHELAHINRGDLWISLIQTILQVAYFYNPLLWVANAIIRKVREQAVDEMVLVAMGEQAEDYPETLLNISRLTFSRPVLSLRLIGVIESKKALHRRIKLMLNRPIPKNAKLGTFGLLIVIITAAILLPMAKAQKQSVDNAPSVLDLDKDGLENRLEAELGTNPESTDTDNDGLSDYDEYCKYRTDPTKKDSDSDGKPDGDWQERREYTYTIRAVCEIRPPSNMEMINDLYQDARPFEKKATLKDARVVEVLIFPFATAHMYSQPYPKENLDKKLKEYIKPTVSMNYSPEMKEQIDNIVEGAATDIEAIEKMLQWMNRETELVRELPHWEYFHITDGKIAWHKSVGDSQRDQQFLETNFLGDSMFKKKVHGTCSSTAILRGTMFRAAGIPTRLVQTLPLITRYSEDPEPLDDRLRMREMAKGYTWGPGSGGANHTYNEVFLNNRWVRVDNLIGTGPFVGDKLFVKAWSAADWNNLKEEWNNKRCFRAIDVSDAHPKYESALAKADIAIENRDLTVKKQPDGRFRAGISIHNYGNTATPQFKVIFYAGDPGEKGRKVYPGHHNAGPIMPGGTWNEGTLPFTLNEGETEIFVTVDPDNMVDELDETNNKASAVVPGRQPKKTVETDTSNKQTTQKEGENAASKISGVDITPADFDIRLDEKRGICNLAVSIQNQSSLVLPRFKLRFYRGDISDNLNEAGNVQGGWHRAGPIEPGKSWGERTQDFHLQDGQYDFNVFLDFDNSISEIDENNNRALLQVRIENGRIANKSVTCPSSPKDLKDDVQAEVKVEPAESKVPVEMIGTWLFDNPHGDDEQMAVFPDGRVVVIYSNGHKDKTNIVDGFIELAEYNNAKCRMAVREDDTLVQYFGKSESNGKRWSCISPEPNSNLLASPTDSWGYRGKYFVKLSDDITVELVGVCDWPQEGKRCWQPDGLALPMEIYTTKRNVEQGFGKYGFMFKVTGPDNLNFSWNKILGTSGWHGSCKVVDSKGNQIEGFEAAISDMEKERLSTTIRIGIASGPWTTIASHDGRRMNSGKQFGVLWSQAFQTNNGTHIVTSREWRKDQTERVVAIDKEGKSHTTDHGSVASGKIDQLTASFRNLKLDQIEEFQYQVRPYQWVEFKNVSLRPGHKTDVEF